ncbi:class I SAM-dependent methyltransferase [Solitalea koreensis]|uniref:Methyltransferase domain-containing protein n=1 Tax=Solitalea koreensis TaxID=543615 RepID=A0A521EJQ0_9SPHI|nr:SAM-dependent methyltransferase [Solitalea koreensis]SMO84134.1 Methyltransferase domain-containing protein [Solitalea koreensis]
MDNNIVIADFFEHLRKSLASETFSKLTFAKTIGNAQLLNIYVKPVQLKQGQKLSLTYHYQTQDKVENLDLEDAILTLNSYINNPFLSAILFTTEADIALKLNKKRIASIVESKPTFKASAVQMHDQPKKRIIEAKESSYLALLGIVDEQGKVIKSMSDKFRQINKYIEIIESLVKSTTLPTDGIQVLDMGSGKGYLTFALYDYLVNKLGLKATVTGIELREELVTLCNNIAQKCGFKDLHFVSERIENVKTEQIDLLIALHACDTATDDALFKGITAGARIIVCAPCCHKQVRKQMHCSTELSSVLKHGIFEERQAEMLTDGIRSLLLETQGYKSKVFEFISNEHTRKNVMIVGTKTKDKNNNTSVKEQISQLKNAYGIKEQQLETLLLNQGLYS